VLKNIAYSPLDGNHEKAGDAIFAPLNKWMLIEFKRERGSISAERKKIENYVVAESALAFQDDHHLLVFGESNERGEFHLRGQTYFSKKDVAPADSDFFSRGTLLENFKCYLELFLKFKYTGGGGTEDYAMVLAVNSTEQNSYCMSISNFSRELEFRDDLVAKREEKVRRLEMEKSSSVNHAPKMR